MPAPSRLSSALPRPAALLLDFGGVIFRTHKRPTGRADLALEVQRMLQRGGYEIDVEEIGANLTAGFAALKHWKHSSSRRRTPREMTHREIVGDFLASGLADGPRELLTAEAGNLLALASTVISDHVVRPGIPELLEHCRAAGIPVGIVSNAHSGRSHRRILSEHGLDELIAVQVYSDEVGIRKPHPEMIGIAAHALGVEPAQSWYVGDTQDRDVAAGRRAGVGAVLLTRSQHTDSPPFPVTDIADAVFEDPRGVLEALHAAAPTDGSATTSALGRNGEADAGQGTQRGGALLIDHGGVISTTHTVGADIRALADEIADRLAQIPTAVPATGAVTGGDVESAIAAARRDYKQVKADRLEEHRLLGAPLREVQPVEFWASVADHLGSHHAWFRAEAHDLMTRFGAVKSRRQLRPGMRELLETCREEGLPVVVVSNTVSGRTVRAECERHGLGELIAAYICSDEIDARKPDPAIFQAALTVAGADPAQTCFLGDKPTNDAAGALSVGIAHRVLISGGSTPDEELREAEQAGPATLVIDSPLDLIAHIRLLGRKTCVQHQH